LGDAEKARGGFAVDDGLDVGAVRLIVLVLLVALREHVRGAHLLEHPLVLGVKDGVQASGAALKVCGVGFGGELGEDRVEEGCLGDGDVALARHVDAGDALLISLRPILVELLLAVFSGGHALVRTPRIGVGAEGLELDGGELGRGADGAARGRAAAGGGRGGQGETVVGGRGEGERRGGGRAGAQEEHRWWPAASWSRVVLVPVG